jgi:hypothetical protein
MDKRVPEAFFDERLREQIRGLLLRISPPANDVVLCHLDAPGWAVVDLATPREQASTKTIPSQRPLLVPSPKTFHDPELGLNGLIDGRAIVWEWTPNARCSVYGTFPDPEGWDTLRKVLSSIALPLRSLLSAPV